MNNSTGKILNIIGIVIMGIGLIGAIVTWIIIADNTNSGIAGFGAFIGTFIGSFVFGMLFIGFSEVIFLLQENIDIKKEAKMNNEQKNTSNKKLNSFKVKTIFEKETEKIKDHETDDGYEDFECPYCNEIISVLDSDIANGRIVCPYCEQTVILDRS